MRMSRSTFYLGIMEHSYKMHVVVVHGGGGVMSFPSKKCFQSWGRISSTSWGVILNELRRRMSYPPGRLERLVERRRMS